MEQQGNRNGSGLATMSPMERLTMRVSLMINHPIAQERREVTIHRLDTDGDREWVEMMGLISETDGIGPTINDDGSATLRWDTSENDKRRAHVANAFEIEETAPF